MKLTALLTFALTLPLFAQDMPQPGPEHKKLEAGAGTWDAVCEMTGPDGQPMTSKALSKSKMAPGGFWLLDTFTGEIMGMKFTGFGATGYDPLKKMYVATWIDSMSPHLMVTEGNYDSTGKVLTMTGIGIGHDGQPAKHRMVTTHKDANTNLFEMFVAGPDGKEEKAMTITYTRRLDKDGKGEHGAAGESKKDGKGEHDDKKAPAKKD